MDLNAYSLQKLNREKRERQPNWTESEKQLLLSLTRLHQPILENKGSDTMTIKRKSQAWDEIALRMKAAGYNRTKDRLKQQLGRIRATESKRVKEALERTSTTELIKCSNISTNDLIIEKRISQKPQVKEMQSQIQDSGNKMNALVPVPLVLQEHQYIKSEDSHTIDEIVCSEQELEINSSTFTKPNTIACTTMNNFKNNTDVDDIKILDNVHFKLQSVQSLAEINHNPEITKSTDCTSEAKGTCPADVTSTIPCSALTSYIKTSIINGNEENAVTNNCQSPKQQQNKRRVRYLHTNHRRTSLRRTQGLRQLHMYRVAIERERLRSIKQQQKRDRILYRKDVEIQNLKLQILRNLSNQNRDGNSINF